MIHFIGRKRELERLRQFSKEPGSAIAAIYGRRRVGKSFLIREALQGRNILLFEAKENQSQKSQLKHFIFQLNQQIEGESLKVPRTWKEALLLLLPAIQNRSYVIVFDEFQWMANYRHDLIADLKYVWDGFFGQVEGQKLILCGSIASFMIKKVIKSSALYGRIDTQIQLLGFKLQETAAMLPGKGMDEIFEAHMLTGGIPLYLRLLSKFPSIRLAMEDLAFSRDGYFTTEHERIFISHFGKNPVFERIVDVLSRHPLGLFRDEITEALARPRGGQFTTYLEDLESAGFISAETPFNKQENARQKKYFLSDAYLRFYFNFIRPNIRAILSGGREGMFLSIVQTGAYHAWIGRSFEYLCMQHAQAISRCLGFNGIDYTAGPYFAPAKKGQPGCQVDLLFDRADNVISVCEMKYSQNPVGVEVIPEMERKIQCLQPVAGRKTLQRVLIVRDKPTRDLHNRGHFYRIIEAREIIESSRD